MNIVTGATQGSQHASVELTDDDMRASYPDWDTKTVLERHRLMMNTGDLLMVDYLRASDMISPEFFRSRVREIKQRYKPKEKS